MPALGFGTLISDAAVTINATRDALEAGFRYFDCAERYGNERKVGRALQAGLYRLQRIFTALAASNTIIVREIMD